MIELFVDFCKLILYGYVIYVAISIIGMFILMGIMWVSWT